MPTLDNIALVFRSGWGLPIVIVLIAVAALLCVVWNRPTRAVVSRRLHIALAVLQVVASLFLVLWLVNPRLRYQKRSSEDGGLALAIDASMSMSARDISADRSRFDEARRLLIDPGAPLRRALEKKATLHNFQYSGALRETSLTDFPARPDPAGLTTDLAATLQALGGEVRGRRLQGIVLAGDGIDTASGDIRRALRDLKVPIYAIGIGRKIDPNAANWKNLGILSVDVPTRVHLDQEVEIRVKLRQEGYHEIGATLQMLEEAKIVGSEKFLLTGAPRQTISLKYTPKRKGVHTFRLLLAPPQGDRLKADDTLEFSFLVSSQTIRVLYVEGRLRWVYKFLRRVLDREASIEADCVIRTGPGKLYQQGKSELILRNALPVDLEACAKYDVIILGDFPRLMLPDPQLKMLDQYIREKKGGLLVIGGQNTLGSGEYVGTPFETLLPARLSAAPAHADATENPLLTRQTTLGRTSSVLAGLDDFIRQMALHRVYGLRQAKPASETLLEVARGDKKYPVLLTQRYGQGRVLLLATEDIWKATLQESGSDQKSPTARFWIQAIQWLVGREDEGDEDDPLLTVAADKAYYDPGETAQIEAHLRRPSPGVQRGEITGRVLLSGIDDGDQTHPVSTLKFPKVDAEGKAEINWTPPHDGCFKIVLEAKQGEETQEVAYSFTVGQPFQELDRRGLNEDLLRELARESGGGYYTPLNAQDIDEAFDRNPLVTARVVETDLVDSPWLFVLFCAIVGAGWTLRRRKNLI